jgi:hypothetical protein
MSMDRDFQTKDHTYDWINLRVILTIGICAAALLGFWMLLTAL